MSNKNKISTNYKDYKYVYTGHEEYMKKHHLDKKEIKEEKEQIIHDHRNVFDFNNPNQHTHDYSFEFQENKTTTQPYKDKYGNTYTKKPQIKTTQNYTKTTTNFNTRTVSINDKNAIKFIKLIFFIFFIMPILTLFIPAIFELIIDSNLISNNNYEEIEQIEEINYNQDPVDALCSSITSRNYNALAKYNIPYSNETVHYQKWIEIINKHYNDYYTYNQEITCSISKPYYFTEYELNEIQNDYNTNYSYYANIENAYHYKITLYGNIKETYDVDVVLIDNAWYLYTIQ